MLACLPATSATDIHHQHSATRVMYFIHAYCESRSEHLVYTNWCVEWHDKPNADTRDSLLYPVQLVLSGFILYVM